METKIVDSKSLMKNVQIAAALKIEPIEDKTFIIDNSSCIEL